MTESVGLEHTSLPWQVTTVVKSHKQNKKYQADSGSRRYSLYLYEPGSGSSSMLGNSFIRSNKYWSAHCSAYLCVKTRSWCKFDVEKKHDLVGDLHGTQSFNQLWEWIFVGTLLHASYSVVCFHELELISHVQTGVWTSLMACTYGSYIPLRTCIIWSTCTRLMGRVRIRFRKPNEANHANQHTFFIVPLLATRESY